MKPQRLFDIGWDHGNYASAYVEDGGVRSLTREQILEVALMHSEFHSENEDHLLAVAAGFVLGYYSSYEWCEVNLDEVGLFEAALRFAKSKGLYSHRDDPSVDEQEAASRLYSLVDTEKLLSVVEEK